MDPAIKRGGRIDHIIGVGPPDKDARRRLVSEALAAFQRKEKSRDFSKMRFFGEALTELVEETERFTRSEIERVTISLAATATRRRWRTAEAARAAAQDLAREHSSGLTITKEEFDHFLEDNVKFSHSRLAREG